MTFNKERESLFRDNESLMESERIRKDILDRGIDNLTMHELADAIFTLSTYLVNIGQLYVELGDDVGDLEAEYKDLMNKEYLKLKASGKNMTDKMALLMAEDTFAEVNKKLIRSKSLYNSVMRFYKDLERIVSTGQTRCRVGVTDFNNAQYGGAREN